MEVDDDEMYDDSDNDDNYTQYYLLSLSNYHQLVRK